VAACNGSLSPLHQLNIDSRIVELIVLSEHSNVAISGRVIIRFAKKFSAELSAPSGRRVLFTRAGWLRHFVARYGFCNRPACYSGLHVCAVEEAVTAKWSHLVEEEGSLCCNAKMRVNYHLKGWQ
jgi:hypothetical protein